MSDVNIIPPNHAKHRLSEQKAGLGGVQFGSKVPPEAYKTKARPGKSSLALRFTGKPQVPTKAELFGGPHKCYRTRRTATSAAALQAGGQWNSVEEALTLDKSTPHGLRIPLMHVPADT